MSTEWKETRVAQSVGIEGCGADTARPYRGQSFLRMEVFKKGSVIHPRCHVENGLEGQVWLP